MTKYVAKIIDDLNYNESLSALISPSERVIDLMRRVRNGVTVRKVRLRAVPRDVLLNLNEEKATLLPDAFSGTVETVYDFIAAYEADGDD